MFRHMRRVDRQISKDEAEQILKRVEYGTLATVCDNGYPYAVPLSFVCMGGCLYFHCAKSGQKLDNIARNSKVSFCVVTDTQVQPAAFTTLYKSVIVFGSASVVAGEEKRRALVGLIEKYSPRFLEKGMQYISQSGDDTQVIKIDIAHMTGKANLINFLRGIGMNNQWECKRAFFVLQNAYNPENALFCSVLKENSRSYGKIAVYWLLIMFINRQIPFSICFI